MKPRVRMPGDFTVPARFFGMFTWADLLRVFGPVLPGVYIGSNLESPMFVAGIVVASFGIAGTWYWYRPGNQPLEVHLYNRVRWAVKRWSQ